MSGLSWIFSRETLSGRSARVDDAAHEAQKARQDFRLVGDEDALDVELDAAGAVGIEQIERPRAGNEQQRGVILPSLGAEMNGQRRLVELPGNRAVEIGVIGGRDLGLRLGPQRRAVGDLRRLRTRLLDDRDRHRDVARLRPDQPLDGRALGIGLGVVHEVQHDARAALRRIVRRRRRDRESALAVRRPQPRRIGSGAAGENLDTLRHHEGRIEADAEAADQRAVVAALAVLAALAALAVLSGALLLDGFEAVQKCLGARARDGAERFDHLVAVHADAVVLDGQTLVVGVERNGNAQLGVVAGERRFGDRLVAQPLAGIRRIGDQLAQKHGFVGIDRMHHQVQEFGDVSLERPALSLLVLGFRAVFLFAVFLVLLGNSHGNIPRSTVS